MAKDWRRLTLSFDPEQDKIITRFRKTIIPFAPESIGLREILMQLSSGNINLLQSAAMLHGYQVIPLGSKGGMSNGKDSREQSTPEKKKEKKDQEKKEARLAPLDVCERILANLNERAKTDYQARGKVARRLIAARMGDGFTEADFYEVHRKKCVEWLGTDMERHLTYETLYGPKFEKYLGQLESKPGQQQSMFFGPVPQSQKQDYTKGVDPKTGRW